MRVTSLCYPARLLVLLVSLPLLLGGCGEKATVEPVAEVKPVEEKVLEVEEEVNYKELEISGNLFNEIAYHKGSPYTGKSINYYVNGKKQSEGNYKDGQNDGLTTIWYTNGQKQSEGNYKDGKEDGLHLMWHEDGQKKSEENFKNGKLDGPSNQWYENGQKHMEGNYKDGKPDGLNLGWYENGKKQWEENYKDGKEDGLVVAWHENGQKAMEGMVENAKEVSQKFWNNKGESVNSFEETGLNNPR